MERDFLIIGNGAAGRKAAETIRKNDARSRVTILSAEPLPSYPRPRLSLGYLAGELDRAALFKAPEFYSMNAVSLIFDRAASVDPEARVVRTANGSSLKYSALLIASGASPAKPPWQGADLDGVTTLHSLADADFILERSEQTETTVIVGGGILGVEIAEALNKRGKRVAIIVRKGSSAVGAPALTPDKCEERCQCLINSGIRVVLEDQISKLTGVDGKLESAITEQGIEICTSLLIATIGSRPAISFLQGSGIETGIGVKVNNSLASNYPDVFAAGDAAELPPGAPDEIKAKGPYSTATKQGEFAALKMLAL